LFCCGHAALLFVGEMRAWGDFSDLNRCIWRDAYIELTVSANIRCLLFIIFSQPIDKIRDALGYA
jgi:hypothetical protein